MYSREHPPCKRQKKKRKDKREQKEMLVQIKAKSKCILMSAYLVKDKRRREKTKERKKNCWYKSKQNLNVFP